jgi:hypothetical protein
VRRHLDGQRRIIEGEALHTYDRGEPRFFERSFSGILVKEPLIVFVLGVLWAYIALFTGAIHPAFGSFLMVGSVDLWLSEALLARYFTVTVRDEIDAELRAAQMQQMREEALAKKRGPLGRRGGVAAEGPAPFHRAEPGKRS